MIFTSTISCQSQENVDIPYLTKSELSSISNKKEKEIYYGDIVFSTTNGEYKLNEILTDSNSTLTDKSKIEICIAILQDDFLYHLHDKASSELSNVIDTLNLAQINQNKINYILLRSIIQLDEILYAGGRFVEIDKININKLLNIIQSEDAKYSTKKYMIESLYSICASDSNGIYINEQINRFNISRDIKNYNDSLYFIYKKFKPAFEKLDSIKTWMEMDKHKDDISKMFENYNPIMFIQFLSFNPSTVLESKKLCELKQNALIEIIKSSKSTSFYSTFRLTYLIELLIDNNYTVRFLDQLMNKRGIKELKEELEMKKY